MEKNKTAAIVLAAGRGTRMGTEVPKQYLKVHGREILYYSLKAFEDSEIDEVILVTGAEDIDFCRKEIVEKYGLTKVKRVIAGGKERYDSVYQGLISAMGCRYILIHDGARPMVTPKIISSVLRGAEVFENCTSAVPVKDTIKMADQDGFCKSTPDRRFLWTIHTPQGFRYDTIREAHEKLKCDPAPAAVTDDTMLVETYMDKPTKLIEGSYRNIKITTPEDLILAEAFLSNAQEEQ